MDNDLKECPYCGELITENAIVCQYCERDLAASPAVADKPIKKQGWSWTPALILVVGIFAFLCIGYTLFSAGGTAVDIFDGFGEGFVEGNASASDLEFPSFNTIRLSGRGDGVIKFSKPEGPAIARISTTADVGNFVVWSLDDSGNTIDLLVSDPGPYWGLRAIDFRSQQITSRFKVNANGTWKIDVIPVSSAKKAVVPGKVTGSGDEVILLRGGSPGTATIMHSGVGNFVVTAYGGLGADLMVDEIGSYSGTINIGNADVLEIQADGEWSVNLEEQS